MTKSIKWHARSAKTQISLGICPVWLEPSLCAQWVAKDRSFLHTDSEDSDQTGRMPRLIWVFAGRTCHFVGFVMRWLIYQNIAWNLWVLYDARDSIFFIAERAQKSHAMPIAMSSYVCGMSRPSNSIMESSASLHDLTLENTIQSNLVISNSLISNYRLSGPYFNMKLWQQVTK